MALFEFELARVEDIRPWGRAPELSLSWFALTDGWFRMPVGEQVLFEYSPAILDHWARPFDQVAVDPRFANAANYQIAAFVRTMLGIASAAVAKLPPKIERLASRWDALRALVEADVDDGSDEAADRWTVATRWMGERSGSTGYLTASPEIHMVRVGEEVRVIWNNREKLVDGIPVWTATSGTLALPVAEFVGECRAFAEQLLEQMKSRRRGIRARSLLPQVSVDLASLRVEQETWRKEFDSYFDEYEPEVPWSDAELALEAIAVSQGVTL
jgi:hypothetical protein